MLRQMEKLALQTPTLQSSPRHDETQQNLTKRTTWDKLCFRIHKKYPPQRNTLKVSEIIKNYRTQDKRNSNPTEPSGKSRLDVASDRAKCF